MAGNTPPFPMNPMFNPAMRMPFPGPMMQPGMPPMIPRNFNSLDI